MPVSAAQIGKAEASNGRISANADILAAVCSQVGYPYFLGCAIAEKETHGENVYGHDGAANLTKPSTDGYPEQVGALANYEGPVTRDNYLIFRWLVDVQGMKSNGVGPMQITWTGHFSRMEEQRLDPWRVRDNFQYGIQTLAASHAAYRKRGLSQQQSFWESARDYNGRDTYADDAVTKAKWWLTTVGYGDAPAFKW